MNICIWPLQPRAGVTGDGPGKDQLEQRQDRSLPWSCSAPSLLLQVPMEEFGECNKAKRQGKVQFSRVTGNKTHACNSNGHHSITQYLVLSR